jgi:arylformamidase
MRRADRLLPHNGLQDGIMKSSQRRHFLHLAAGAATLPVMNAAGLAQPVAGARVKGTPVWLDMDQKELDDAYDQRVYARNAEQVIARVHRSSELARQRLGEPRRLAYGSSPIEALDLYATTAENAPINIYVHGGGWRAERARDNASQAEMLVKAGAHLAVLDFNNVTETGGSLMAMADQIRRAVVWVFKNARSFGGDPERIYVSGHSSGGHWVGVLLTTDWRKEFGVPATIIKGGVAGSGMFDLKAVRLSARGNYVKFTDEAEDTLSAQRHLDQLVAPIAVVYGTAETPEFQRQSRDFAAAVKMTGKPVTVSVMEGYNHFEVWEQLANPYSLFGSAVLEQMKLRPA